MFIRKGKLIYWNICVNSHSLCLTVKYLLDKLVSDIQIKMICCLMLQTRIAVYLIKVHGPP